MLRRLYPHPVLAGTLVIVWLLLQNRLTAGGILVGIAIGTAVPILTAPYWPGRPRLRLGVPALAYLGVVLADIIVANFQVAGLILFRPSAGMRSGWLVIPLEVRSPEAIAALAATISLTPGTVSADLSACGRSLLVHALHIDDADAAVARIKHRYERRLRRFLE